MKTDNTTNQRSARYRASQKEKLESLKSFISELENSILRNENNDKLAEICKNYIKNR